MTSRVKCLPIIHYYNTYNVIDFKILTSIYHISLYECLPKKEALSSSPTINNDHKYQRWFKLDVEILHESGGVK